MSIINQEALDERARRLFTVPTEIAKSRVDAMTAACVALLTASPPTPALYKLDGTKYVLSVAQSALTSAQTFGILGCLGVPNGIKLVLVQIVGDEARLEVHFFNRNHFAKLTDNTIPARLRFPLSGGHRLQAGQATGQVQVTAVAQPDPALPVLRLTVKPIGDYSTYKLHVDASVYGGIEPVLVDPMFSEVNFKFRPGCFTTNCAPAWEAAPAPTAEPVIDYLAKDYESFRHTMIAAMMERVPGWEPTSEADLDQVLLELFSAAADELSDYQDRVMNEAYLASARKRVSLARHARLMDYHIHQGNQATTWLALEVALMSPSVPEAGASKKYFLEKGFRVWAGNEKQDASSVVFLTRERVRVHQLVNRMSLYTWNDSIPSLAAGSTTADLRLFDAAGVPLTGQASATAVQELIRSETIKRLLIQEHLNPVTGNTAGRDFAKRQLLRLLPGVEGAAAMFDPVTAEWFVRVRWQARDALRSNYCFTVECGAGKGRVENVSLFHGNLVEAHHGRPAASRFEEPGTLLTADDQFHYERTARRGTLCRLPESALAYRDTPPGGDVPPRSTLVVTVELPNGDEDEWDEVPSLVHSDASDENGDHYTVETDEEGRSLIRFGNGVNGKELPERASVRCAYQVGRGEEGNIGTDKLINSAALPRPILKFEGGVEELTIEGSVVRCWNPFDVTNGRAAEAASEIIRRVPEAYRVRQLRAVTLGDYVRRAEELPEVSRASARYAWTGSWHTVRLTIDPAGTRVPEDELRLKVARHLDAVRLIGEDLEIRPPRFVPLDIRVALCVRADVWTEDVRFFLEQEFSDGYTPDGRPAFFHPDRWTFGQALHASQIVGRALAVPGVEHVISVTLKRWNEATPGTDEVASLRHNEIIQVVNDRDHMELGFIEFDVRGGRQ